MHRSRRRQMFAMPPMPLRRPGEPGRSALASNQTGIGNNMRIISLIFLVTVAACEAAFAQNNSINELRQMFDYDQKLPLDVKEVVFRDSKGVRIHDIHYANTKLERLTDYVVKPF